jgi:hypothetical protein
MVNLRKVQLGLEGHVLIKALRPPPLGLYGIHPSVKVIHTTTKLQQTQHFNSQKANRRR